MAEDDSHFDTKGVENSDNSNNLQMIVSNNSMVPVINVAMYNSGGKYNGILEDTIRQVQRIRQGVTEINNTIIYNNFNNKPKRVSLASHLSTNGSKPFSSCPNLYDTSKEFIHLDSLRLFKEVWNHGIDRRKSWSANDYLTKNCRKSTSLSSLDSEGHDMMIRRDNSNRSEATSISTASLNDADLKDIDSIMKCNNKMLAAAFIPLQKSISTPSIAHVKPTSKTEGITNVEPFVQQKRRKRGSSLFFSKKKKDKDKDKDKAKLKNCHRCNSKIYILDDKEICKCKPIDKNSKLYSLAERKSNTLPPGVQLQQFDDHHLVDKYDRNDYSNLSDESPLLVNEFYNEGHIGLNELNNDPILGIANEDEKEQWSASVSKEVTKHMTEIQIKRQEHIYEFIMTEKHHCQTLYIIQKVFVEGIRRYFGGHQIDEELNFKHIPDLINLHVEFLHNLRVKQRQNQVVDSIADVLLDYFCGELSERLRIVYGEFCANHNSSLDRFKYYLTSDVHFEKWYRHCQTNPLLKKKGIPECMLFVAQRLTKYPLLIEPLLKCSRDNPEEQTKLRKALGIVKQILIDVDGCVAEKQKENRFLDFFEHIDPKSTAIISDDKKIRKHELLNEKKLEFEGIATLMQGKSKPHSIRVIVLNTVLVFLTENSQKKYVFFNPDNKACVVPLHKLIIREKAESQKGTDSQGIYIISSNPKFPEMYELRVESPKDKNVWIQAIRNAVKKCAKTEEMQQEKNKFNAEKNTNARELIAKMRQKDIEQAILLEEKLIHHVDLLLNDQRKSQNNGKTLRSENIIPNAGIYKNLIDDNCDTTVAMQRAIFVVKEINSIVTGLYSSAVAKNGNQNCRYDPLILSRLIDSLNVETVFKKDDRGLDYFTQCKSVLPSIISNVLHDDVDAAETESILNRDTNGLILQISHHLSTLLCTVSQQMTTISSLQNQLMNSNSKFIHKDQLEELRNLQDKFQEEKKQWMEAKEQQEKELNEQRTQLQDTQSKLEFQQKDIKEQRDQLYRKMEKLSSQGLLLSPNTPLPISNIHNQSEDNQANLSDTSVQFVYDNAQLNDRKEKYRASTYSSMKTPPNANNKSMSGSAKQQLPMKLSSLSQSKGERASIGSIVSPVSSSSGVTQLLPLKLADKKNQSPAAGVHHSRTESSPAAIQQTPPPQHQQHSHQVNNPTVRTNTYPQIPEKFRIRSPTKQSSHGHRMTISGTSSTTDGRNYRPNSFVDEASNDANKKGNQKSTEDKVIYF